jgi:BlaI family penicillinase repressor
MGVVHNHETPDIMDVSLGDRELDIMSALWRDGPGTVPEVRGRLSDELAYNTVLTILRNLEQKGLVDHTAEGRSHRYFSAVPEATVRGGLISQFVEKLFGGSPVGLLTHLVESHDLSRAELRDLHKLLDERVAKASSRRSKDK